MIPESVQLYCLLFSSEIARYCSRCSSSFPYKQSLTILRKENRYILPYVFTYRNTKDKCRKNSSIPHKASIKDTAPVQTCLANTEHSLGSDTRQNKQVHTVGIHSSFHCVTCPYILQLACTHNVNSPLF